MSYNNTTLLPCPECKRKGDDHLVKVYVPDEILEEYRVDDSDGMENDDLYYLGDSGYIKIRVCHSCAKSSRETKAVTLSTYRFHSGGTFNPTG